MSFRTLLAVSCLLSVVGCGVGEAQIEVWTRAGSSEQLPEEASSVVARDAGTSPESSVCSSDTYWTSGNSGSSRMNPGRACISCHVSDGPTFAAAGTVYPTIREPNLCNGLGAVAVELTDANGVVRTATTNTAGNFSFDGPIALPYRARLLYQGRVRAMASAQMNGDCNSCHTETGLDGAPGRVMAP